MNVGLHDLRTDAALVKAALARRPKAFEALIARHQSRGEALALAIGVRPEALPDVLQEAFLRGFQNLSQLRKPDSFQSWFLQIVRNTARTSLRNRGRMSFSPELEPEVRTVADEVEMNEVRSELWRAVDGLSEGVREAICLYYYEGESVKAVARSLGISRSAAKDRLQRGRDALRDKMWRKFGEAIREMVPSSRERRRRARKMSLLMISTTSLEQAPAGLAGEGVAPATGGLGGGALVGGLIAMGGKKIAALTFGALVLLAVGVTVFRGDGSPEEEPGGSIGRGTLAARNRGGEKSDVIEPTSEILVEVEAEFRAPDGPPPPPVDFAAIDRDRDLFGVVMNASEDPVAGARVETVIYPWRRVSVMDMKAALVEQKGPATRTASDGTFAVRLRRGQLVDLQVSAEGYATIKISQCVAGGRVKVVLPGAAGLEVVATDEEKRPVPGVQVQTWRPDSARPGGGMYDNRDGVTDADGRCLFTAMAPGDVWILVRHDTLGDPGLQRPEILEGATLTYLVTMPTGRTIRGRVTDATTGAPIEGARMGGDWTFRRAVLTAADGRYVFRGWIPGQGYKDLTAVAEGFGRQSKPVPAEGDLNFELERGHEATGQVVGQDRQPVEGAVVTAFVSRWGRRQEIDTRSARTDPDGRFLLTGLRTDFAAHNLMVQARGQARSHFGIDHRQVKDGRIDLGILTLSAARNLEGRVLDSGGMPLSRIRVTLSGPGVSAASLPIGMSYGREEDRMTDDIGRFRFPDVPPGKYALSVQIESRPLVKQDIHIPPDRDVLDVEVIVQTGQALTVRVEDSSGRPIAGAGVSAGWGRSHWITVRTDDTGAARLQGLPSSEVSVSVDGYVSGHLSSSAEKVVPSGQEIRVVLQDAAEIRGVVLGPDRRPLPAMYVEATRPTDGNRITSAYSDESGVFSMRCAPGMALDLAINGHRQGKKRVGELTAYRGESRGVVAPALDVQIRTWEIAFDRSLIVIVHDPDGNPVPSVNVVLSGSGVPADSRSQVTDAEGRVRVDGLTGESILITVLKPTMDSPLPEGTIGFKQTEVVPDGQEVVVSFSRGVLIRGVILDPDGQLVEMATVRAMQDGRGWGWGLTDESGRFSLAVAPDQTYRLDVRHFSTRYSDYLVGSLPGVVPPADGITMRLSTEK
ncbi:MAG: sigma-70 family RNA polymerase sigma factor [Planctomycetota bacterium]|nr:sigma-70 family RNA polymerase sigma factor [Planctomycetota bacterium]